MIYDTTHVKRTPHLWPRANMSAISYQLSDRLQYTFEPPVAALSAASTTEEEALFEF